MICPHFYQSLRERGRGWGWSRAKYLVPAPTRLSQIDGPGPSLMRFVTLYLQQVDIVYTGHIEQSNNINANF